MRRSTNRILTTHVGSLPRPPELIDVLLAAGDDGAPAPRDFEDKLKRAVNEVVQKQVDLGVDVVDDGEFSKRGFAVYSHERLDGLTPSGKARPSNWAGSREALDFPEFYAETVKTPKTVTLANQQMVCTGPITYKGKALLERDLVNLKEAVAASGAKEAFVPAISPCDIAGNQRNEYYKSDEEFLYAIADAMNVEYRAIVDAGFVLQVDDPRLIDYYTKNADVSIADCRKWAEKQVEAINYALKGIPEDKVRYHTCYGINMGPRVHDMEMKDYMDIVLKVNAQAYLFEHGNPRHEHEWELWADLKLPDGKILVPGVITHSSLLVEHPRLICQRLVRFAKLVGRENVLAGGDCGFGTQAKAVPEVHPSIVWAKFAAMAEGARLASEELWH